jgi:DNA-binding transcriptional ArsR family regulator
MSTLEAQLTALTREFVARLVEVIRNASFADVASLSTSPAGGKGPPRPRQSAPRVTASSRGGKLSRQTASHRAELGERVMEALRGSSGPMGVRALSSELGVSPDRLAAPLKELRGAGKIRKHGDKRSTTYSAA